MPWCICEGQNGTCGARFSSSKFMQFLGIKKVPLPPEPSRAACFFQEHCFKVIHSSGSKRNTKSFHSFQAPTCYHIHIHHRLPAAPALNTEKATYLMWHPFCSLKNPPTPYNPFHPRKQLHPQPLSYPREWVSSAVMSLAVPTYQPGLVTACQFSYRSSSSWQ